MNDGIDDFKNEVCNKFPNKRQEIMDASKSAEINDEHKGFFRGVFFIERLGHIIGITSNKIWSWFLRRGKKKIDERDTIANFISLYNKANGESLKIIDWRREKPDCICKNESAFVWAVEHTMITRDEMVYEGNSASEINQIIKLIENRISKKDKSDSYKDNNANKENILLIEIQPVIGDSDLDILKNTSFALAKGAIKRCFALIDLSRTGKTYVEIKVVEGAG